jgi:DNA-binding HxlR family transcriptional regulator
VQRTRLADVVCSLARTMDVIGEWWTPLILRDLLIGVTRFEDLRRDLGIASNVLADRLATLTKRGVVERRRYQANPARFEYILTEKGRDILPALAALLRWGDKWESGDKGAPALLVHQDCDKVTTPLVVCDHCHRELSADNVTAVAGPGGRGGSGTTVIAPILAERAIAHGRRARNPGASPKWRSLSSRA